MAVPPHTGAPPPPHPDTARADPPLVRIALQIGATAVSRVDVATMLSGVCAALCPAAGVAGAVLLLTEPADPWDPRRLRVFASDPVANRLGVIQREAGRGPVHAAIRAERPLTVPDLTATGPPELAAAAADCGLVRSLVVPVAVAGRSVGGLQLLTRADAELAGGLVAALWPVVSALAARLSDVRELARLRARPAETAPEAAGEPSADAATGLVPLAEPPAPAATPDAGRVTAVAEPGADATTALPIPGTAAVEEAGAAEPAAAPETGPAPPERDPVGDLFATGEPSEDTPPMGQPGLGWEDDPQPPSVPARPLPLRVRVVGRVPRIPAAVPAQRSAPARPPGAAPGPGRPPGPVPSPAVVPAGSTAPDAPAPPPSGTADPGADAPTWRVPRHRLRDDD